MKKILKNFALALTGLLTVFAIASCDEKHEHKYEVMKDATGHWTECACGEKTEVEAHSFGKEWKLDTTYHWHECECGYQSEEIPHAFGDWIISKEPTLEAKGERKKVCADCGREKVEELDKLKPEADGTTEETAVYAVVPADWTMCNIYFWTDGTPSFMSWPGLEMTLVDAENCLYGYILPAGVENVIFNNGSAQTIDIVYQKSGNLYTLTEKDADGKYDYSLDTYVPKDTDPELNKYEAKDPSAVVDYKIYAQLPAEWTNPSIYWWGTADAPGWPGVAMEVVDAEKNIYSYEITTEVKTVIFNYTVDEVTIQTEDLAIAEGVNGFVLDATANAQGKFAAESKNYNAETGEFESVVLEKPVLYLVGSHSGWAFVPEYVLAENGDVATITIELAADTQFKVSAEGWAPQIGWGGFTDNTNGALVSSSDGNIVVVTAAKFVITVSNLTGKLACEISIAAE